MKYEITAKRLQKALSDCNLKARELADKAGVSESSVSQYVNGSHAPSNISSGKMGAVLGVNPLWLMGFDVDPKKALTTESANKDFEIVDKLSKLEPRDKDIVLNMIDTMIASKKT